MSLSRESEAYFHLDTEEKYIESASKSIRLMEETLYLAQNISLKSLDEYGTKLKQNEIVPYLIIIKFDLTEERSFSIKYC